MDLMKLMRASLTSYVKAQNFKSYVLVPNYLTRNYLLAVLKHTVLLSDTTPDHVPAVSIGAIQLVP